MGKPKAQKMATLMATWKEYCSVREKAMLMAWMMAILMAFRKESYLVNWMVMQMAFEMV